MKIVRVRRIVGKAECSRAVRALPRAGEIVEPVDRRRHYERRCDNGEGRQDPGDTNLSERFHSDRSSISYCSFPAGVSNRF